MKQVAQLGNSHALAITEALIGFQTERATISSFPPFHHWSITTPESEGGARAIVIQPLSKVEISIVLDDFDLYVVSAAGGWACRNRHLMIKGEGITHPLGAVRCIHWGVPNDAAPKHIQIISRAAFQEMVYTWVSENRISQLVRFLAMEANKKVIWLTWPVPSRSLLTNHDWLLNIWYDRRMPEVWREYRAAEQHAVRRLNAEYGNNVTVITTPRSEMEKQGFMDEDLASSSDPFHGNVKYGALVVESLAQILS